MGREGRVTPCTPPPRHPALPARPSPARLHAPPSPPAGQSPWGPHRPCLRIGGGRLPVSTTVVCPPLGGERHRFTPLPTPRPPGRGEPVPTRRIRVPARRAHVSRASLFFASSALPPLQRLAPYPSAPRAQWVRQAADATTAEQHPPSPAPPPRPAPFSSADRPSSAATANHLPAPSSQPIGTRVPAGAGQRIRRPGAGPLLGGRAEDRQQSLGGGC